MHIRNDGIAIMLVPTSHNEMSSEWSVTIQFTIQPFKLHVYKHTSAWSFSAALFASLELQETQIGMLKQTEININVVLLFLGSNKLVKAGK